MDDYFELQNAQIIMTTPVSILARVIAKQLCSCFLLKEKWDSMTRKWRDNKCLVQMVKLFLIDEIHQLNDESRGPTMEAIVSRMKTIRASVSWESASSSDEILRFMAISATIPNIQDVSL